MKKIDDLFKQGLNSGGLPYKDAYWQQMETLLNEKLPVSRKKPLIWIILGITTTLLATLTYFLFPLNASQPSQIAQQKSAEITQVQQADKNQVVESKKQDLKSLEMEKFPTEAIIKSRFQNNHRGAIPLPIVEPSQSHQNVEGETIPEKVENEFPVQRKSHDILRLTLRELDSFPYRLIMNPFHSVSKSIQRTPYFSQYIGFHSDFVKFQFEGRDLIQEKLSSGRHIGIDYAIKRKHWYLISGMQVGTYALETNYSSFNHQVTYDTTYRLLNKQYTQTPRGTQVALVGHVVDSTVTDATRVDCPNCAVKIQYLSIPLRLGYEWSFGRIRIHPSMGVRMNLFSKGQGRLANPNVLIQEEGWQKMQEADLSKDAFMRVYFPQVGYAVGLNYRVNSRLDFRGEYLQWNSTSPVFLNSEAKLKESGLSVGLIYRLR